MSSHDELAMLAQAGPAGLGLATNPRFACPAHLQLINAEIIEAIARGRERQRYVQAELAKGNLDVDDRPEILLIEVPPRHGKSTLISEHTPPWYLGMFPDDKVILASYEADFASTWGAKARDIFAEHAPELYGLDVDRRTNAAKRWDVAGHKGGMVTAGVGGPITGKGANLLIIDDPVKNSEEALSEVIRKKHKDWWLSTARTRLEPGAVVIVLMTRWHHEDLGGMLLASSEDGGDPVREIRLPALAEKDDPLGRAEGEALWPQRYGRSYLEHTRKTDVYWFTAMYQGKPTPDEGGIFARKYFRYFEIRGDLVVLHRPDGTEHSYGIDWCQKFQAVDLAASEDEMGDYTVMAEIWVTPDADMLVRSIVRDHIAVDAQPDFFLANHAGGPVKVESIGYQSGMIGTLLRKGFPAEPVYPDKDKVTRAGVAGALYRGGKVYHHQGAEWLADFEIELLAFPVGSNDDQVDTIAYAARALPDITLEPGRKQKEKGRTVAGGLLGKQL